MEKFEQELHEEFSFYGKNAREWMRKCEFLLPKIEKYRIWRKKGFSSIYVYAYKLAGMSQRKVDECLRIMRKIEDKPILKKIAEEKGLGAIRPIATIATEEDQDFWAEKAREMSKHTLETYVREYKKEIELTYSGDEPKLLPGEKLEKKTIMMQVDPEVAEKLEKLSANTSWNELMKEYLQLREEKLEKEKPEPKEKASRPIPAKIEHYVHSTTNGTCCFPGCCKKAEVLHHIDRFALSRSHDPTKIVPLCKAHHDIVHQGLIANEDLPSRYWKIRKTPDMTNKKYIIDQKIAEYKNQKFA